MTKPTFDEMLRAALKEPRAAEMTEAEVRDVLDIVAGERALQQLAQGFVMADLLLPDAWQETSVPRCGDCARTLFAHNGHWTCVARGCPLYGESQGDGAPEDES